MAETRVRFSRYDVTTMNSVRRQLTTEIGTDWASGFVGFVRIVRSA